MLKLNQITKQYKAGKPIFSNISMEFEHARGYGLVGPNGSGKTTFLRVLSVNSFPTVGSVTYDDIDIHQKPVQYLKHVGLVHDEETLPRHLTATELLQWIIRSRKLWDDGNSPDQINTLLDKLALEERDEPIGTYSTGMKKKTQIAAAFIVNPDILIMDEPLRGLDQSTRSTVFEMIVEAKRKKSLILMASHSMRSVNEIFDKIVEFPL